MRIPKEISAALKKRTKAANDLNEADGIVSNFIMDNGIEADEADFLTGVEMYANPYSAECRIREAIKRHKPTEKNRRSDNG